MRKIRTHNWPEVLLIWGVAREQCEKPTQDMTSNLIAEMIRRQQVSNLALEYKMPIWWLDKTGGMTAIAFGSVNMARFYTLVAMDFDKLEEFLLKCDELHCVPRAIVTSNQKAYEFAKQRRIVFWNIDKAQWPNVIFQQIKEGRWYFG